MKYNVYLCDCIRKDEVTGYVRVAPQGFEYRTGLNLRRERVQTPVVKAISARVVLSRAFGPHAGGTTKVEPPAPFSVSMAQAPGQRHRDGR